MHATLMEWIHESEECLRRLKLDRPPLAYVCQTGLARDREEGLWLEFGTGSGSTTKVMCSSRRNGVVHTFDWFQGLPTDWLPEFGVLRGHFAQPQPDDLPGNAALVVGRFEETLPPFLESRPGRTVDLLHVDCDVYASARFVLDRLTPRIGPGTVIVFDELFYYPGREHHEAKALYEWLTETKSEFEWIGTHGEQSGDQIVVAARTSPDLAERCFTGPDENIIACDVPVMDRAALVIR